MSKAPKRFKTDKEIRELIREYRQTEVQILLEEILYNYFPLILKNAKRYKHPTNDIGDLFHEATIIAISAIKIYYNIDDKTQFNTYLTSIIRRQIKDSIDRYAQAVTLGKHIIDKLRKHRIKPDSGPLFEKFSFDDLEQLKEGLGYVDQLVVPIDDRLEDESLQKDINLVFDSLLQEYEKVIICMMLGLNGYDQLPVSSIAERLSINIKEVREYYSDALNKIKEDDVALQILETYKR
jgi:RNA polymerase sigma factor (sigma-70 family)